MYDNSLANLPVDLFDGLTSLETLSLSKNNIASPPEDLFDGLTSLENLNALDENSLTNLPVDLFDGLTGLVNLDLSNNSLTSVPEDLFDGLTSLENLWLGFNSLTSVPEDLFDGLTSLEKLRLSNNSLTSLPENLFEHVRAPQALLVWLTNNPDLLCLPLAIVNNSAVTIIPPIDACGLTATLSLSARVHPRERWHYDGYGLAGPIVQRGDDGDGLGRSPTASHPGGLRPEQQYNAQDCCKTNREYRRGDDYGGGQRCGCAGQKDLRPQARLPIRKGSLLPQM